MTNDDWPRLLCQRIDVASDSERSDLAAFVYMPEQIHLLTLPQDHEPNLGRDLAPAETADFRRKQASLAGTSVAECHTALRGITAASKPTSDRDCRAANTYLHSFVNS